MPQGKGTYGDKVGRPKKRTTLKKGKIVMPKVKTNLKGTDADKIIGPAARSLKRSSKAIKSKIKKIAKKATKSLSKKDAAILGTALGMGIGTRIARKDARKRSKNKKGS